MKILKYNLQCLLLISLLSCKVNQKTKVVSEKPLPKSFLNQSDTVKNELVKWKEIIFNPTLSKFGSLSVSKPASQIYQSGAKGGKSKSRV